MRALSSVLALFYEALIGFSILPPLVKIGVSYMVLLRDRLDII